MKRFKKVFNRGESSKQKDVKTPRRDDSSNTTNSDILLQQAEINRKLEQVLKQQKELSQRIDTIVETTTNLSERSNNEMNPYKGTGVYDEYSPQVREAIRSKMPFFREKLDENHRNIERAQKDQEKLLKKQVKLAKDQIVLTSSDQPIDTATGSSSGQQQVSNNE